MIPLSGAVPAYLLLCLLLGGSGQGIWSSAALQLLALPLIGWAAMSRQRESLPQEARQLLVLAIAGVLLTVIQLLPLPPGAWAGFPGRELIEAGYGSLGYEPPWLPLSWTPYETLEGGYALLPPLAVLAGVLRLRPRRESWIAGAVILGALASILLAAVQVGSGARASWAYLYPFTNTGAVGFFANRNHMASLLLAAIPFAAALFAVGQPRRSGRGRGLALSALGGGGFVLLLVGLLLNSSLAALGLAVPVIALAALLVRTGWRWRQILVPSALLALFASLVALTSTSVRSELVGLSNLGGLYSREQMWELTLRAIGATFPVGTGIGSFPQAYATQEDPTAVTNTYVNHAHNDYLEIVLETGMLGLLLLLAFLAWWAVQAARVWRSPSSSHFAKAATIASAAILAHSVFDYPLRTSAIAAVFAACVALMAPAPREPDRAEARHVRIA